MAPHSTLVKISRLAELLAASELIILEKYGQKTEKVLKRKTFPVDCLMLSPETGL